MKGILGRKKGMTEVFTTDGKLIPVTVIEVEDNVVSQIKTKETDGYDAIQLATVDKKESRSNKPETGHLKKANATPKRFLKEIRGASVSEYALGDVLKADTFAAGEMVDVTGTSKGKGFQGGVKRWNFRTQDATHGNSLSHRVLGSIGQNQTPGRVFKGKKMAGHLGAERVTVQSLEVVRVDAERKLLLVKGSVPGAINGDVIVKPAVKA